MSSGLNCAFIQAARSAWYYLLEHGSAPKNSWDWREFSTAYGPFSTQDSAHDHLLENHSNPGGHSISELPDGQECLVLDDDPVLKRLISEASPPVSRRSERYRWR